MKNKIFRSLVLLCYLVFLAAPVKANTCTGSTSHTYAWCSVYVPGYCIGGYTTEYPSCSHDGTYGCVNWQTCDNTCAGGNDGKVHVGNCSGTTCGSGCSANQCPSTSGCVSCTSNCDCGLTTCKGSTCRNSCNDGDCLGLLTQTAGTWGDCVSCVRQCTLGRCGGACTGDPPSCAVNGTWSACVSCDRTCSATCGGSCGIKPSCAVNGTFSAWSPNNCTPQCGQTVTRTCSATCGGTCSDAEGSITSKTCSSNDSGEPGVPVINYPVGTSLSPVVLAGGTTGITLSLGGTASKADLYYYGIYKNGTYSYGLNSTNPVINVGITGLTTGVTYSWRARSLNNTCIPYSGGVGVTSAASSFGYFRVNSLPTFTSLIIKNADSGVVVGQAGGSTSRNHICQSTFQNSTSPRRVIFEASVSDADGASDIGSTGAVLKWNGKLYTMTKVGSPVGVGATMRATVDFGVGDNSSGTYDLFVTVTDIYGGTSGEVNTNRDFKVWDCQVPVSGTLFQAPDGVQVCSTNSVGIGFSIPIEDKVGFESITFSDTPNVVLTDDDLDSYGSPNNVIWGKTYLPLINGGDASNIDGTLLATGRQTRIIDIGGGTTTCSAASQFTIDDARVSPYSATPRAQVDFSFIQDQESWYQVSFAGIRAKSSLTYGVPYTAPDSSRFLTLGNSTTDNGLVSAISFTNINGNNNNEFGSPKNWWINKNISGIQNYSYDYFYNNLFLKKGIGSTGTTWNQRPSSGIFFVSGNLSINSNQVSSTPPLVIVRGGIDITTDVTQLDGIYIADGNISIGGTSASALNVNGSLYAGGNIRMYRSFTNKTINNTTPAVKVNYNPGLIMRLPVDMVKVLSNWRSE